MFDNYSRFYHAESFVSALLYAFFSFCSYALEIDLLCAVPEPCLSRLTLQMEQVLEAPVKKYRHHRIINNTRTPIILRIIIIIIMLRFYHHHHHSARVHPAHDAGRGGLDARDLRPLSRADSRGRA